MIGALDSAAVCIMESFDACDTSTIMPSRFISAMVLLAERRNAIPFPAVALAGVGIGELIVAVVGERQVTGAAVVEFFDVGDVFAERIAVLDADESNFFPFALIRRTPPASSASSILSGAISLGEADGPRRIFQRRAVGALVAGGFERFGILRFPCLADINDEEQRIEPAVDHVG